MFASKSAFTKLVIIIIIYFIGSANVAEAEAISAGENKDVYLTAGNVISPSSDIEQITCSVLRKQLELEKLNTEFRIETTLVGPWRQRRMFAYGESNAALVFAGLIKALPVRYNLARKKIARPPADNKNRDRLVSAARIQLVGQCIGAGGDIVELGLNFIHYFILREKGFNPAAYQKKVHLLHDELDKLLLERQGILAHVSQLSAADLKVVQAESQLLHDLRDLSLLEYRQYLSGTKRFWAFQNTAYVVDFLKNATGAAGNIVALEANHIHHRHLVGTAFLLSTISGAIVMVTPVVGRVTGNISGLAAEKTASNELLNVQTRNASTFMSDKAQFDEAISNIDKKSCISGAQIRKEIYQEQGNLYSDQEKFLKKQRERARSTIRENIIFAAIVGPPRIANGILGMIGSWHYYNNSPDRNRCIAAGNTAYLAGTAFNILETARVQASAEFSNRKLAKSNLLPRQQLSQRLQLLESMDQSLTK